MLSSTFTLPVIFFGGRNNFIQLLKSFLVRFWRDKGRKSIRAGEEGGTAFGVKEETGGLSGVAEAILEIALLRYKHSFSGAVGDRRDIYPKVRVGLQSSGQHIL